MTECKSILYSIYSVSLNRNGRNTAKQNATSYSVLLTSLTIKLVMCLLVSKLKLGEASASLLNLLQRFSNAVKSLIHDFPTLS